jgi:putative transposase
LEQLEQENARLKKLVAERDLELEVVQEPQLKNGERAGTPQATGLREGARAFLSNNGLTQRPRQI